MELHGYSDASQLAYAGVVYLRMVDESGDIHISLVLSKTKVAPIKRLTIPRLELCGAQLLAKLLHHCKTVFRLPPDKVFAWTDSTIVLNWLIGNPRRFNTYVGNRVSCIVELIAPDRWNHVESLQNPADCASRGLLPSELLSHSLWWTGPDWLQCDPSVWRVQSHLPPNAPAEERDELCHHVIASCSGPILPLDRFSSFARLTRVTAWVLRFAHNCRARLKNVARISSPLTTTELRQAEHYWISLAQKEFFSKEIGALKADTRLPSSSPLLCLNPFLDKGLLRVGGREKHSKRPYDAQHPMILHAKHPILTLLVRAEHVRLLHAGPLLLSASLSRRFHLVKGRNVIRSLTRAFVICRCKSRAKPQMMGQLPAERVTPGSVFDKVGVDYAGPIYTKIGAVRRPTIVKSYIAVFVSLSVKAVHRDFIPEHAPHFGGLWEAAVKSTKKHLSRIVGNARLSFEELTTVLCQIEAVLNSRPLIPLPGDGDNIEVLTPGHFLIGRPLEAIPDPDIPDRSISSLRRWQLCQCLVQHFWKRWSAEYLTTLQKFHKWRRPTRNFEAGDVVILREDTLVPTHWPMARVIRTHPGKDGLVRVVVVKTNAGTYTRPTSKVALLLPNEP